MLLQKGIYYFWSGSPPDRIAEKDNIIIRDIFNRAFYRRTCFWIVLLAIGPTIRVIVQVS